MNGLHRDPPRWRDGSDQCDLVERAAGDAARCARALLSRPAPPLARVAARIRSSRQPRRPTWVLAAAAFILGVATAASAARLEVLRGWLMRVVGPQRAAPAEPGVQQAKPRVTVPAVPAADLPSAEEAAVPPSQVAIAVPLATTGPANPTRGHVRMATARGKVALIGPDVRQQGAATAPAATTPLLSAPPASPPSPPASAEAVVALPATPTVWPTPAPVAAPPSAPLPSAGSVPATRARIGGGAASPRPAERQGATQFLTEAIRLLRAEQAPREALRFLDGHDRELGQGGFGHEALILRVEAWLALGRPADALRLLDGAALSDVAASRALLVTRGELRAGARRCTEGIGDFDLVLARSRATDRQALVGRALCRKQLGDSAGARMDVERLRKEFPNQPVPAGLEP